MVEEVMDSYQIDNLRFTKENVQSWASRNPRHSNWPVVYILSNDTHIYVGESVSASHRLEQHIDSGKKSAFKTVHIILDDTFNKSACLDLEASLIRWFTGDYRAKKPSNRNLGVFDADYFDRENYKSLFRRLQAELREKEFFSQTIEEIENSDLFKFSPFKTLNDDQLSAMKKLVKRIAQDPDVADSTFVVTGGPGTGKTIFAMVLAKYLSDINQDESDDNIEDLPNTQYGAIASRTSREKLRDLNVGLVVPQQALRKSIQKVAKRTTGLKSVEVLSPFQVGELPKPLDVLIVDETHRLRRRSNMPNGTLNRKWPAINEMLFGMDDVHKTQLDWVDAQARIKILLVDVWQSIAPFDVAISDLTSRIEQAKKDKQFVHLKSQMRVRGGDNYVETIRAWISGKNVGSVAFGTSSSSYDFRIYDEVEDMVQAIRLRNREHGLGRLVAGYAWKWRTKGSSIEADPNSSVMRYDIEIGETRLRWNSQKSIDWVTTDNTDAEEEVGSIHSVQGYDLNYAGVIIGPDLKWDSNLKKVYFDRSCYFDRSGKQNLTQLEVVNSDADLLQYVLNIYGVLLTRGIMGTYVYVCDPELRARLRANISIESAPTDI